MIARIAVSAATYSIDKPYDYLIPERFENRIKPGVRVNVPFSGGNRICEGIVLAVSEQSELEASRLKEIISVLDDTPVLTTFQLRLAYFLCDRFYCTLYSAVKTMLPAGLWFRENGKRIVNDKMVEYACLASDADEAGLAADQMRRKAPKRAELLDLVCSFGALPSADLLHFTGSARASLTALEKAGYIRFEKKEVYRRPKVYDGEQLPLPVLNAEQQQAANGIAALAARESPEAALLYGVTGSGKTGIYMHLIAQELKRGKDAILLVPEISLTPQMLETFSARFGENIAVLHSSLSPGERYDEWKRIRSGKAHLVIGTRSAIFAPLEHIGIVILDEEQDESYRSENAPRYNTRDVAKYICARNNALLLMGSATPDISSMYYAQTGRYQLFTLSSRYNEARLPDAEIVDMRQELKAGRSGNISRRLAEELETNLNRGEQSILFMNRRGTNKLITCGECGFVYQCPRCSVALTYHGATRRVQCHHCGYSRRVDQACPQCGGILKFVGAGTELIEQEVKELFPTIDVLRVDTDTVTPAGSHEVLFDRFRKEQIPVMVGTQMVAKGHNFENVTLVGVISADQSLYAGDYRASERTFAMITQVVGRSGRGAKPGRALIQTFTPMNETIFQAATQNYSAFYDHEIHLRKLQSAPPFCDLIAVTVTGENENHVILACAALKKELSSALPKESAPELYGPVPMAVVRVNNRYRYRINIACTVNAAVRNIVASVIKGFSRDKNYKGVTAFVTADPID